jgi:iron complex transport system ATP-binding protein
MIELKSLTCKYDNEIILENISAKLNSHITLLGANGSGKSTLAKALCKLIEVTGEILLDERSVSAYSPIQRAKKISYIPTKLEFYDEFLSLEEFVLLGRFPYKKSFLGYSSEDIAIAQKKMELLNLSHLREHSLASLSSGETNLALIAQALTQESSMIIFDEPTANLDPKNAKIIAQHIKNLKQTHQTVLITHDIYLANFIENDVLFLKDKKATYFTNDFFTDENLSTLYDVKFSSLKVQYD